MQIRSEAGRFGALRLLSGSALAGLFLGLMAAAMPAFAQDTAESRLRKLEAEVRALQRQVFPGGDGRYFTPEVSTARPLGPPTVGTPATTPVTDLLARMDALEGQITRLTSASELNTNRIAQIEAKLAATVAADIPATASAPDANLSAMTVGSSAPASRSSGASPSPAGPNVGSAATRPSGLAKPSPQRLAAVRAVAKPATGDAGDDEYSYGYRLWEAKFYPEAQQQLKLMIDRHPRHERISYARNLLGRAYLDSGDARTAAQWFFQNHQNDKRGARAPDSLLFLADAMRRLGDTNRACVALAEFGDSYAGEAAGRLKADYDRIRAGVKCN